MLLPHQYLDSNWTSYPQSFPHHASFDFFRQFLSLPTSTHADAVGCKDDPLKALRLIFYVTTVLPWTIVQVYDAINHDHKRLNTIWKRLMVSTVLNVLATSFALGYMIFSLTPDGEDFTEAGAMLVALVINSWFWLRNGKGYMQRRRFGRLRGAYLRLMTLATSINERQELQDDYALKRLWATWFMFGEKSSHARNWKYVEINNEVIDNDLNNAVAPIPSGRNWKSEPGTSRAFWMGVWQQARRGCLLDKVRISVDQEHREAPEYGSEDPNCSEAYYEKYNVSAKANGREELQQERAAVRKEKLADYPDGPRDPHSGQQDVRCVSDAHTYQLTNDDVGFCRVLAYVAKSIPHPLTNAWYQSDAWEEAANAKVMPSSGPKWIPPPPGLAVWNEIAESVAKQNEKILGLGAQESIRYAGRILAASHIIAVHHSTYVHIVKAVHQAGRTARWTYGWSGRLACYSALWTLENVYLALLDGLTFLAIHRNKHSHPAVIDLLVALASFTIMEERSCGEILEARQRELGYRYTNNKDGTCRGSGMKTIRDTCALLNIPDLASKLDGLPAFLVGWAAEYRLGRPGNQFPEYGEDHDQIEKTFQSFSAIRFPNALF